MTPRPGDFGVVRRGVHDPVGRMVQLLEWANGDGWSVYTHAVLVLDDGTLIEAEPGGARIAPITEYAAGAVDWSSWPLSAEQRAGIMATGRSLVGTPYSFLDYAALAAHRLHLPLPGLRRYVASTGHMICSQLVDYGYQREGVHLFTDNRWPGYVTPTDLGRVLQPPMSLKDGEPA